MTTWRYCTHDVIEYGIVQLVHISDKRSSGEETAEAPAPQIKTFLFSVAGNRAFPGIYSL